MDKFLEIHKLPKLTQNAIGNMNIPITSKDIESVIKILPRKKRPGPNCHKPENAKGDVKLNVMWYPGWDPGTVKGIRKKLLKSE